MVASLLPSWIGWITLAWGLFFAGMSLKMAGTRAVRATPNALPLLPMVMQLVIGISLLVKQMNRGPEANLHAA
ncbi:MAG TPA: hypothetical protein VJA25_11695 [Dehalococcoidia bacterium]|nr:hypothetical protein [Dehalococcoidia bacterium]